MDWIALTQEGSCEHGNELSGSKFLSSCATGGFSIRAQLQEVSLVS
jgi:hypothetical protein